MDKFLEKQILSATEIIEQQIDSKLEEFDNLKSEDDFEELRKKRILSMKKAQAQKEDWLKLGHGSYSEIFNEPDFFDTSKKSKNMICHFYRPSTSLCQIVDKHLENLSSKHIEAKFVKINVERCQFLAERLRIKVMPTICLIKDSKIVDYIVGFNDFGAKTDFPSEMMEWRIAQAGIINYNGDLMYAPISNQQKKFTQRHVTKSIYTSKNDNNSDTDED